AIADYSKAISLNSNDVASLRGRGAMYQAKGDYPRAVDDLTRAIGLDPTGYSNYFLRGNVRRDQGQTDLAIGDYSKAIQLNPNFFPAYGERAKLYRQTGRDDLADADDNKAKELGLKPSTPAGPAAWITRAEDEMRHGHFDEVLRIAEEQLAKEKLNAVAIRL